MLEKIRPQEALQKKSRNFCHTAGDFSTPWPPNNATTDFSTPWPPDNATTITRKSMFAIFLPASRWGVRVIEWAGFSVGQVGACFCQFFPNNYLDNLSTDHPREAAPFFFTTSANTLRRPLAQAAA